MKMSRPSGNDAREEYRILIVDDDRDFGTSLNQLIDLQGYQCVVVQSPSDAKKTAETINPQVALIDLRLGKQNGIDLIGKLKESHPDILCVLMTAYASLDVAISALHEGVFEFLTKPIDDNTLLTVLNRCFDRVSLQLAKKKAEEELQRSEERFRDLIEGSIEGILIHRNFKPLFLNRAMAYMLGYSSQEEFMDEAESVESLLHPFEREMLAGYELQRSEGKPAPDIYETRLVHRNGAIRCVEVVDRQVNWDGEAAVQGTYIDITERKRAEEELRQAQKMEAIGQLTGGIAHDFNNILQIISGHTDIAQSLAKEDKAVLNHLDIIVKATERGGSLTQQMLAFSRQQVHKPQEVDINGIVTHLVKMLSRVIGENIDLQLELAEHLKNIYADPSMIEQVLLNLCVNSRDAMPNGGKLTISTKSFEANEFFCRSHSWADAREYCLISVSDTGKGMPPDVLEKIFEPFFTTKAVGQGTGLGLSMAYGIIQQHGGNIIASSEVGIGTTFNIYLPAESEHQELNIETNKNDEAPGGTDTILVVEDEEGVLLIVKVLLEGKGYKVLTASNGVEALNVLDEKRKDIDLILLDVIMPQLGGREVFEKIKDFKPSIPIVFSTGYADHQLDENFLKTYNLKQLSKPYSSNELFVTIRQALEVV